MIKNVSIRFTGISDEFQVAIFDLTLNTGYGQSNMIYNKKYDGTNVFKRKTRDIFEALDIGVKRNNRILLDLDFDGLSTYPIAIRARKYGMQSFDCQLRLFPGQNSIDLLEINDPLIC